MSPRRIAPGLAVAQYTPTLFPKPCTTVRSTEASRSAVSGSTVTSEHRGMASLTSSCAPSPRSPNTKRPERQAASACALSTTMLLLAVAVALDGADVEVLGFEGGKGFPGGSVVFDPRGKAIARAPLWEEALLPVRLDLREISAARVEQPLLSDLERALPGLLLQRRDRSPS